MISVVKIPMNRSAVVIGEEGKTRKDIEKRTGTSITVDQETVEISGEALDVVNAENIVKAIGRGFAPATANMLLDESNTLAIITIANDKKKLERIKARLIGVGGKARRNLERLSQTHISIYGKTISIIGQYENVDKLCVGLEKLIKGTSHRFVYQYLEKEFSEMRKSKKDE